MEKILYLFVHLGLPVLIILSLWLSRPRSKVGFVAGKIFQVALLVFLYQWGQYALTGSYYIRFVLLVILLATMIVGWLRWRSELPLVIKGWQHHAWLSLVIVASSALIYLILMAFSGLNSQVEPTTNLEFPLKDGTYYISSGGTTAIVNNHFRNYPNSQQFAVDINQLNRFGSVSDGALSNASENHLIFGREVYSPCAGTVLAIRNDVRDNATSTMQVDHDLGRGNYVDLRCDGLVISIFHLKQGSIRVQPGEHVTAGQLLAQVGNSGFSMEPHLHIQAARPDRDSVLVGVPATFNGRWLVRNTLVLRD